MLRLSFIKHVFVKPLGAKFSLFNDIFFVLWFSLSFADILTIKFEFRHNDNGIICTNINKQSKCCSNEKRASYILP